MSSGDVAVEQRLRNQLLHQFKLNSNDKKRRHTFDESRLPKRSKTSHRDRPNGHGHRNAYAYSKHSDPSAADADIADAAPSKADMIQQLREMGLVQGSKSKAMPLPPRNDAWKTRDKQHKLTDAQYDGGANTALHPNKRRRRNNADSDAFTSKSDDSSKMDQLSNTITIYPLKPYLWYNLYELFAHEPNLCGLQMDKKRFFAKYHHRHTDILGLAQSLYRQLVSRDEVKNEFHKFTLAKGTFRDKISTWILRIDQFALTRLSHLDSMLHILQDDVKRQSVTIIPLLMDLFMDSSPSAHTGNAAKSAIKQRRREERTQNSSSNRQLGHKGLLPQRDLLTFGDRMKQVQRDDAIACISQMDLILFYFEHLLKQKYRSFVELLEYFSANSFVEKLKTQSVLSMYKLLRTKPENELLLLNLLINKFGDKDSARKIAEFLLDVAAKHPVMKPDMIREVNTYLLRPSLSPIGLFRGVFFLTRLRFTSLENEAATLLCGIYMDLFKQLMCYQNLFDLVHDATAAGAGAGGGGGDGQANTGSNQELQIFMHESDKNAAIKNHEFTLIHKLATMSRKRRAVFFKSHHKELLMWKRFVQLEEITPKLLTCILRGISYAFPFAKLELSVFKADLDYIYKLVLKANLKIALMALQFTFRVESTAETFVSGTDITDKTPRELIKYGGKARVEQQITRKSSPSDRFYQVLYAICSRWDFVTHSHPELLFNLLYQCVKCDHDKRRITAFIRRLLQFCCYANVSWICGALYLLSAIFKIHPFVVDLLDLTPQQLTRNSLQLLQKGNDTLYNIYHHEPTRSNSNLCPIWELHILRHHMHPAVRDFVQQLLRNKHIEYAGDPLKDFKRAVLFEKFTRVMAHKMAEFKPKTKSLGVDDKQKLLDSYLAGDEFIAIYKAHETDRERHQKSRKREKKQQRKELVDEEAATYGGEDGGGVKDEDVDIDEDDPEHHELADEAMFKWLKSNFGSELPDDQTDGNEEFYDYTEFKQEMKENDTRSSREKKLMMLQDDEDEDVDVYVSDVDKDYDNDNTAGNAELNMWQQEEDGQGQQEENDILEEEMEAEDLDYDQMTEEERKQLADRMIKEDFRNDNIVLPEEAEFVPSDEMSDDDFGDEQDGDDEDAFLEEEDEEEDGGDDDDDDGDFFAEQGYAAGELRVD